MFRAFGEVAESREVNIKIGAGFTTSNICLDFLSSVVKSSE